MCIRNIGHNKNPNIDTTGRVGKQNDHTLTTFAENLAELPEGWVTHSEMMGFPAGASTISMVETSVNMNLRRSRQEPEAYTLSEILSDLRRNYQGQTGFLVLAPAVANMLKEEGFETKDDVRDWIATASPLTPIPHVAGQSGAARARNLVWVVVAGDYPGMSLGMVANMGGQWTYQTQLISGATLTENGQGATAPGTPQNFTVTWNDARTTATLTWDAPLRDGGSPITGYQVTLADGGNTWRNTFGQTGALLSYMASANNQGMVWHNVDLEAMTFTFDNLHPGAQYFFRVRAINGLRNAVETIGVTINAGGALANATNPSGGWNLRASGVGAWAMITPPTRPLTEPVLHPVITNRPSAHPQNTFHP
jgi:hypothetical protein